MEEKTFYKSRGHWFASKEEAEEWDKRIEAEENQVYKYLLNAFPADLYSVYSEKELDEIKEEIEALGITEKEIEKYNEGAPSKFLDDYFDKLPITQARKSLEALSPSQFLRFIREIKFFEECFLDQRVTVIKDNYLIRGEALNKKQDFFDWLKDHEINPPPDTIKEKGM